jgi:hypothetical protein
MADVYIGALTVGAANATSLLPTEDAAGTVTTGVTQQSVANLMVNASNLTQGTLADARLSASVVLTGDVRLTNPRTPSAHSASHASGGSDQITPADIGAAIAAHAHGSITTDGKLGSTSGLPLITGASGAIQAGSFGTSAGQFCQGNDARLSDSRAPVAHASDHQPGGADPIMPSSVTANLSADTNSLSVAAYDIVRLTSSAAVRVNGMNATGCPPGKMVLVVNENAAGGAAITIAHLSSSASSANRVRSQFGSDVVLQPDGGQVLVHLSPVASCWRA